MLEIGHKSSLEHRIYKQDIHYRGIDLHAVKKSFIGWVPRQQQQQQQKKWVGMKKWRESRIDVVLVDVVGLQLYHSSAHHRE